MTSKDINRMIKIINDINKTLPDKAFLRKEVKEILMQVVKECEKEVSNE